MLLDFSILPENIVNTALELSAKIDFFHVNEKADSGYVLIRENKLTNKKVVVKFYYWGNGAHAEPKLLATLESRNILQVYDAAVVDEDYAYFMTPFCDSGDVDDFIDHGGIGVRAAVDILIDILNGVSVIHERGFIHRDLKPSNIFCHEESRFVIGDFGSVVRKGDLGYAQTISRHSLLYRTPEEIASYRAYEQGDIYQIGIVLYQLLGGSFPYNGTSWLNKNELTKYKKLPHPESDIFLNQIIEGKILKGKLLDLKSLPPWCPSELISIIRRCCKLRIEDRYQNVSEIIGKLNNIRSSLPDWRLESFPVLYRDDRKFRLVDHAGKLHVEKMARGGTNWRRIHSINPSSTEDAIKEIEQL